MITVLLVDDHEIVRAGVRRLLADVSGVKVIADVASGEEAVKFVREKRPNVVLMDVRMPGIGGLEATRKLLRIDPDIKVIVLTSYNEEPFPSKLVNAGALGYMTKETSVEEMVLAIRTVHAGQKYMSPEIAQQLAFKHLCDATLNPFESLSEREMQVLIMITSGQKVQDISDKLCLSPKTVNTYRYRLFEKLGASSDVDLTHLAIRHGILDTSSVE
jgi:two-component system invasion response regulator UvrY